MKKLIFMYSKNFTVVLKISVAICSIAYIDFHNTKEIKNYVIPFVILVSKKPFEPIFPIVSIGKLIHD